MWQHVKPACEFCTYAAGNLVTSISADASIHSTSVCDVSSSSTQTATTCSWVDVKALKLSDPICK